MAKYTIITNSRHGKNYAFEFTEMINGIIATEQYNEIASAELHTLTIDESTDVSVNKYLILYFKFRVKDTTTYIVFGEILHLLECDANVIIKAIKTFYFTHNIDLYKMVIFTSVGASVMLGRINGVAAQVKQIIPHLIEQHCVAHQEDL